MHRSHNGWICVCKRRGGEKDELPARLSGSEAQRRQVGRFDLFGSPHTKRPKRLVHHPSWLPSHQRPSLGHLARTRIGWIAPVPVRAGCLSNERQIASLSAASYVPLGSRDLWRASGRPEPCPRAPGLRCGAHCQPIAGELSNPVAPPVREMRSDAAFCCSLLMVVDKDANSD
jgi:hypothetical protein